MLKFVALCFLLFNLLYTIFIASLLLHVSSRRRKDINLHSLYRGQKLQLGYPCDPYDMLIQQARPQRRPSYVILEITLLDTFK
ncbi:hypothetical protein AB4K20DRAFT_1874371 [Rhizopus microsporus]